MAAFADLLMAGVYQGTLSVANVGLHAALVVSAAALSGVGSLVAFAFLRDRRPTRLAVAASALLFGLASLFGAVLAAELGGVVAAGAWLLIGAAAFATGACLVGRRRGG